MKDFLINKGIKKMKFTEERCRIDCFYKHSKGIVGAEIKNRDKKFESYSTYIMEVAKYDFMTELLNDNKCNYCQIVYFFGDTAYLFNYRVIESLIRLHRISSTRIKLPNSTDNYQYDLYKTCYLLPKEYATKYKKINGNWKLISKSKSL